MNLVGFYYIFDGQLSVNQKKHRWDESQPIQYASDWMRKHEQRFKSHTARWVWDKKKKNYYEDKNKQWKML